MSSAARREVVVPIFPTAKPTAIEQSAGADDDLFAPPSSGPTEYTVSSGPGFGRTQTFYGGAGSFTFSTGSTIAGAATIGPSPTDKGSKMSDPTREEIDAKLAALDAKNDARFERMIGEMRTSQAELSGRIVGSMGELRQELKGEYTALKAATAGRLTVILTGFTSTVAMITIIVAIIFGLAASGQTMFGLGQSTREIATTAAMAAADRVIASQPRK